MEGLSNHGWVIFSSGSCGLSNSSKKSFVEALRNGGYGYQIHFDGGKMPNWLSFHGEGSSLSFHVPPVFQGLVLWFALENVSIMDGELTIKIKSNGIQLFKSLELASFVRRGSWIRYISISEMEMEELGGDEELELSVKLTNTYNSVKECGIHVIAEMPSFEELEVGRDRVISAPYHSFYGSISSSTIEQWKNYLLTEFPLSRMVLVRKFSPDFN
uniref:TIR-NBS-LRR disease resistance-like protein n=1 Tax=Populus alba TaxID=43335 RepID=A0A4U5NLP9_POPAL|nr:TIR-NBS-LRR disease resistance-like protein [Populus alba]